MDLSVNQEMSRDGGLVSSSLDQRIDHLDWKLVYQQLDSQGFGILQSLLTQDECNEIIHLYDRSGIFRSRIVMERYRFGKGEYQYFLYPLPAIVKSLREQIYPYLVPVANRWNEGLKLPFCFPETLDEFTSECHQGGQERPTPLLLKYGAGDFNCFHQDLYGEKAFPLQVAIALSQPNQDFTGGEFILVEQKPRMQSRAHALTLNQGDAIVFAVSHRPVQGNRGFYRVNLKHGVSTIRSGQRFCLGIIFHDAA